MALLTNTKIRSDGSWVMTPSDARELAAALIYAANESQDHESICPINVGGFEMKSFYINVNPHLEKKDVESVAPAFLACPYQPLELEQKSEMPKPPLLRVINDRCDPDDNCPKCRSSQKRNWFGFGKLVGCLQPECENYYKRTNG